MIFLNSRRPICPFLDRMCLTLRNIYDRLRINRQPLLAMQLAAYHRRHVSSLRLVVQRTNEIEDSNWIHREIVQCLSDRRMYDRWSHRWRDIRLSFYNIIIEFIFMTSNSIYRSSFILASNGGNQPSVHSQCESRNVSTLPRASAAPISRARISPTRCDDRTILIRTDDDDDSDEM